MFTFRSFRSMACRALALGAALVLPGPAFAKEIGYKAEVEVQPADADDLRRCQEARRAGRPCALEGVVFEDRNRDGKRQRREPGIPGVLVSNGLDVVKTDRQGEYTLPARDVPGGNTFFITKPAHYEVPVDQDNVPQFFYHHHEAGSPPLRFGGLAATGPLPGAVNFPLVRGRYKHRFKVVVSGDTQPYSNNEVGYVRDTLARDVAESGTEDIEMVMIEGDIVGDDLGLLPRFKNIMRVTESPLYFVGGNHDLDFDAKEDAFSFDTFKREWGPTYYSFDIGQVHFVGLDDMRYPCTPELDNQDGRHPFCADPATRPTYTGVIDEQQIQWLANDLRNVPVDKLVILNMHIPLVSYIDHASTQHQVSNTLEVYGLLAGRKALALSGHTHTLEQLRPGELYEGWQTAFDKPLGPTPIPQIVTGAACGSWWSGDFANDGVPMSVGRLGAPRGYLVFEFEGNEYRDRFKATGMHASKQMALSILSPTFQAWYGKLLGWLQSDPATRAAITPVGINDLPDPSIITRADQAGGTYLVANVWNGSRDSKVWVLIDGKNPLPMERTQRGEGEGQVEFIDPFAIERQAYVLRYAIRSESGDPRAQGFELYRGARFAGDPQPLPENLLTRRSTHLWRVKLPDLAPGAHTARVITVDVHGRMHDDLLAFEILDERPPPFFRSEVFE